MHDIWKSGEKFEKSTGIKTILGENNRFCHNKNGLKKQDPLKKKNGKKALKMVKSKELHPKKDHSNAENAL